MSTAYVFPEDLHNDLVARVYMARGYERDESEVAAYYAGMASKYGIKTHAVHSRRKPVINDFEERFMHVQVFKNTAALHHLKDAALDN